MGRIGRRKREGFLGGLGKEKDDILYSEFF